MMLVSKENVAVRQEALESARVVANKILESTLGLDKYVLKVTIYPHLVMREHKQLGVAGADRLSDGMRRSFGKPTSRLAEVKSGQVILEASTTPENERVLKNALDAASYKLPMRTAVTLAPRSEGN